MADSNRKQIWKKMETALKEITALKGVSFGLTDIGADKILEIIPMTDPFERSSKTTNKNALEFVLRVICPAMVQSALYEYEDLAPLIKAKMVANRKWDGLAYDTILQQEKWLWADAQHPDTGVDMHYVIEYDPLKI